MKFIFTVLSVIVAINSHAQSFELYDANQPVIPLNYGDTIVVTDSANSGLMMQASVNVKNTGAASLDVNVTQEELSVVSGAVSYFNWGLYHYPAGTVISAYSETIGAGATNNSFYSRYDPFFYPGSSFYRYNFFDVNNPFDSAWIVIQFNALGTTSICESQKVIPVLSPNPVKDLLHVSFPENKLPDGVLYIYNPEGSLLCTKAAWDNNNFDVSELVTGLYMLKVISGNQEYTCKFIKE